MSNGGSDSCDHGSTLDFGGEDDVDSDGNPLEPSSDGRIVGVVTAIAVVVALAIYGLVKLVSSIYDADAEEVWGRFESCNWSQPPPAGAWKDCASPISSPQEAYRIQLTLSGLAPGSWTQFCQDQAGGGDCYATYEDPIARTGVIRMDIEPIDSGTVVLFTADAPAFGTDRSAHVIKFRLYRDGQVVRKIDSGYTISAQF